MTLHAGYAASRISSNLKGSTKQFGWLQAFCNQNLPAQMIFNTLQPSEFIQLCIA